MITIDLITITIEIIFLVILIPYIYIKIVSGFANDVIGRLVSANFSIDKFKFLNLYIGYMTGSLLFTYIFYQLFKYKVINFNPSIAPIVISIAALSFCYIARIVTREHGHVHGKQYITAITSLATILFLINTLSDIIIKSSSVSIWFFYEDFLARITNNLIFSKESLDYIFLGSVSTATLGEFLLIKTKPNIRSIPIVLEKFPSDFMIITGNKGIHNKMKEMTNPKKEVNSLKMITRTLEGFQTISPNLRANAERDKNTYKIENFKIIAPVLDDKKIRDIFFRTPYLQFPLRYLGRLSIFNSFVQEEAKLSIELYKNKVRELTELNGKTIQWKDKDLENFRLLIVNDKEAIMTILGTPTSEEKIGIFTKEPYLVECLSSLFDRIWEK